MHKATSGKSLLIFVLVFYLLTFAFTAIFFGLTVILEITDQTNFFYQLPQLGPLIATIIILVFQRASISEFLRQRFRLTKSYRDYLILLFPIFYLFSIAVFSQYFFGVQNFRNPEVSVGVVLILQALMGSIAEEVGWRGLLLPKLQSHYPPLKSALIVGVLWGLWHVPVVFQGLHYFVVFFIHIIAFSIILAHLYNKSNGSLLLPILMHTVMNCMVALFLLRLDLLPIMLIQTIVIVLWAGWILSSLNEITKSPRVLPKLGSLKS